MATVRYTTIHGEVIAEKRGGMRKLYVPDPLGSTVALLDNTQTKTDTFSYWPYGEVSSRTGTTPTPFQFVGTLGYYTSGMTYVRARYLDTAKTRWITQDPIGFEGGDINVYRYVRNKPVDLTDRSGYRCSSLVGVAQDVCLSCSGLNPISNAISPHLNCANCCNALGNISGNIALIIGGFLPIRVPYLLPSANVAACQCNCETQCTKHPSGAQAVRNYISCVYTTITTAVLEELGLALLGRKI